MASNDKAGKRNFLEHRGFSIGNLGKLHRVGRPGVTDVRAGASRKEVVEAVNPSGRESKTDPLRAELTGAAERIDVEEWSKPPQ